MPSKKTKLHKKKQEAAGGSGSGVNGEEKKMEIEAGSTPLAQTSTPTPPTSNSTPTKSSTPTLATPSTQGSPTSPLQNRSENGAPAVGTNGHVETDFDPQAQAERLKEGGNAAFKAKRFGEAVELYTKAIALDPTSPTYLTNRAAAHMSLSHYSAALSDCLTSLPLSPAPPPKTLLRIARCHLFLGSPAAALSTIRGVPGQAAREAEGQAGRVLAHLETYRRERAKGEWEWAGRALGVALRECGGTEPVEWKCWRGEMEIARGKWDGAGTVVNDAFAVARNSPDVLHLRGLYLFLTGKLPAATQHALQALTLDPEHIPSRTLLRRVRAVERAKDAGNVAFRAGNMDEALRLYGEALEGVGERKEEGGGGPLRATLLANRAAALVKMDKLPDALLDVDASLALVDTAYKPLRTRARILLKTEDYEGAVRDFKAALEQVRVDGSEAEERGLKGELREAEVALKRSKTKDYYKILDIPKDCSEHDIKRAYRKQSLLHHPDKGGDEEKFKLASEAYNVLSDSRKRARYDAGEDDDEGGVGGMGGMNQADLASLFATFGGGGGGGGFNFGGFEGGPGGGRFHTQGHGGGFSF